MRIAIASDHRGDEASRSLCEHLQAAGHAVTVHGPCDGSSRDYPDVAVLESLFHGVNPRSLIVLAQARGALLATVARLGLPVAEYSPAEVKTAVTGHGRADKAQVARMVVLILGLGSGEKLSSDASDALAVAICYAQRLRLDSLGGRRAAPRQG